jgi:UDP-glucose 4-epimerase
MPDTLLLTGGTGYIGSHAAVKFMEAGYHVILLDNLSNSSESVLDGIAAIAGARPSFFRGDIRDRAFLHTVFSSADIRAVVHFAGLKSVGESVSAPFVYYDHNIAGTVALLETMLEHDCRNIVFSSSATVYRADTLPPFTEHSALGTSNPYGTTKLVIERLLEDLCRHVGMRAVALRYFNPIGAHASGLIGERPSGVPNNLLPYILDVAAGRRERLLVYGGDYPTPDGTGVRDYVHVSDLAGAHVSAVRHAVSDSHGEFLPLNIGTGQGTSVLRMIAYAEQASDRVIPYEIVGRRSGDIASVWCDPSEAQRVLGWRASLGVPEAVADAWRFVLRSAA